MPKKLDERLQQSSLTKTVVFLAASPQEKISALRDLQHIDPVDDLIVTAVTLALDDPEESVRAQGIDTLGQMLAQTNKSIEKNCIMRHIMQRLFGRFYSKTEYERLFKVLEKAIEGQAAEIPHLLVWLMQEVESIQDITFSDDLPDKITAFYERIFSKSESHTRSREIITEIFENRYLNALLAETTPTATLKSILKMLGKRKLADISLNLIVGHISPILRSRNAQVICAALSNLQKWASEFPCGVESINQLWAAVENWRRDPEHYTLTDNLLKQLAMNAILVKPLIDSLLQQKKSKRTKELRGQIIITLLNTLTHFYGVRYWMSDVCDFILKMKGVPPRETFECAISFLSHHLTGLDPYEPPKEPTKEAQFKARLLRERNLKPDKIIRNTLKELAFRQDLSKEVRNKAWHVLIVSMPPDLIHTLNESLPLLQKEKALLSTSLQAISNIHPTEAYELLRKLWAAKSDNTEINKQLIRAFGALGNREVVDLLLPVAFDDPNPELIATARDVLSEEGYSSEIQREQCRRDIEQLNATEKLVSEQLVSAEHHLKTLHQKLIDYQTNYNETSQKISSAINEQDIFSIEIKLKLSDLAIQLAEVKGKLQILISRAGELEKEVKSCTKHIQSKVDDTENALHQLESIRNDIENKENQLHETETRLANEERSLYNFESSLNQAQQQLRSIDRSRPRSSAPPNATAEQKLSSKRNFEAWESRMYAANAEINRITNGINTSRANIKSYGNTIFYLRREIPKLKDQYEEQGERLDQINKDRDRFEREVKSHYKSIDDIRGEIRQLQHQVSQLTTQERDTSGFAARGMSKRKDEILNLQKRREDIMVILHQTKQDFFLTESKLEELKTRKQYLIQQVEQIRQHYDTLGDRCEKETFETDARNLERSRYTKVLKRGNDEQNLAANMAFESANPHYRGRNEKTVEKLEYKTGIKKEMER